VTDLDRALRAFAHPTRRALVLLLDDLDAGWITVPEATTRLRDASEGVDERRLRIELVHSHLPALEDAGVIAYDRRSDRIELRPPSPAVADLIELCRAHE